jgi:MFS family permease
LIGDLVKQDQRSKGFSFYSIASLLGTVFGLGIATFIGNIDWRMPYFIVGIIGLFSTILIVFFKEPSRIGKDFSLLLEKEAIEYTYRINISDLKVIFKKKSNLWLIVNFVDTIPTGIIIFLIFAYMEDYHNLSSDLTLVILLLIMFSILLGTIIFGFVGDYLFKKGNKKARILLALFGNVAPIPFIFIALIIPFEAPVNTSIGELFLIPGALAMIILFVIGIFLNGPVSGSWFASVVDLNLPEHRGTVLATANFFDIVGRSLGPLIGAVMADLYGYVYGMMVSIFAFIALPFFWIPVLKNVLREMEDIEKIFSERLELLKRQKKRD